MKKNDYLAIGLHKITLYLYFLNEIMSITLINIHNLALLSVMLLIIHYKNSYYLFFFMKSTEFEYLYVTM